MQHCGECRSGAGNLSYTGIVGFTETGTFFTASEGQSDIVHTDSDVVEATFMEPDDWQYRTAKWISDTRLYVPDPYIG